MKLWALCEVRKKSTNIPSVECAYDASDTRSRGSEVTITSRCNYEWADCNHEWADRSRSIRHCHVAARSEFRNSEREAADPRRRAAVEPALRRLAVSPNQREPPAGEFCCGEEHRKGAKNSGCLRASVGRNFTPQRAEHRAEGRADEDRCHNKHGSRSSPTDPMPVPVHA